MACKSCEKDKIQEYLKISKYTGANFFYFINDKGNEIVIEESLIQALTESGMITSETELTPIQ